MEERRRECFLLWASLVVSKPVVTLWLRWKHHTDERKIRNISEVPWGFFDARCPFWGSFSIATFSFSCLSCPVCGQQQKVRERHKKPFYKENSSDNLCSNFWEKCRTSIGKPVKRYFESSSSESHWNRDCHNKISRAGSSAMSSLFPSFLYKTAFIGPSSQFFSAALPSLVFKKSERLLVIGLSKFHTIHQSHVTLPWLKRHFKSR